MKKKNILCTICARKGSKGLKNKNILKLLGKPLILHTIAQAKKIKPISKIVISTNSKKILNLTKNKVDLCIKRPEKLSNDRSSKIEAIKHALYVSEKNFNINFEVIIDLDVTSPLRNKRDITNALNIFLKKKSGNLVSGHDSRRNPYFNQVMYKKNNLKIVCEPKRKINRRQDAPVIFDLNASIYIWKRHNLINSKKLINKQTIFFKMPYERSVDIDDKLAFLIVEHILNKKLNK